MIENKTILSIDELKQHEAELRHLKTVSRSEVIDEIIKTWKLGNLDYGSAFDEAKTEQARIEMNIYKLETILKNANYEYEDIPLPTPNTDVPEEILQLGSYGFATISCRNKEYTKDCELDHRVKVMIPAMRSLGYYAALADYEHVRTTIEVSSRRSPYSRNSSYPVLLTNANEVDFSTLWYDEYLCDDEDDEETIDRKIELYREKYTPVDIDIYVDYADGFWADPSLSKAVGDTIGCFFPSSNEVHTKINQPPKYNSDKVICFYSKGDYQEFSNFYLADIHTYKSVGKYPDRKSIVDKTYASVEHYFQIMKAMEFDPEGETLKQMGNHLTCAQIKSLGRKVQNFDATVWNIRRRFHMRDALTMKFYQNKELREMLLGTGDAVLAEASPRDTFWGIGYSGSNPKAYDPTQWRGKNVLGNMLMYLRDSIREQEQRETDESQES